jgi:uncharacterized membrane protein
MSASVVFNYVPDWRWLAGAAVLGTGLLFLAYSLAVGRPKWWLRLGLLATRWIAIASVVLCLLDPQRVEQTERHDAAPVAILVDSSQSMGLQDVPGSRLEAVRAFVDQRLLPAWPSRVPRLLYTFSGTLEPLPGLDSASPTGRVTALAGALEHLLAVPREEPLAGIVVCSDGIDSAQGDPVAVAKMYRRKGIPIHTATFGTALEPRDIVLANVQVKRAIPNLAPTKIVVTVRGPGFIGQTVPVEIRFGNEVVVAQTVRLTGAEQRVEMDFTPHQRGFQMYEVRIPAQDGEWLTSNNRRVFGVEVVDPTIHVIYLEGTPPLAVAPIPEWKYLKDALESDKDIKVKVLYQPYTGRGAVTGAVRRTGDTDPITGDRAYAVNHPTQGFPKTMAELLRYDVIIHSDIKTLYFTPEQLQNMARFVEQYGGGFIMIGGNSAFGKGGYQNTIIDRIIPVAMQQLADSATLHFQMRLAPGALNHPLIAIGATRADTVRIWTEKLPPLHGFNRVDRAKPGAIVLATTPSTGDAADAGVGNRIVLAVQEIGKGRSMAFTSDTTRTWGADFETIWGEPINPALPLSEPNCDSRYYRAFWINAIRWLAAGKVSRTNNAVSLELSQSYSLPNHPTTARVKVRDPAGNDLPGVQVALVFSRNETNKWTNSLAFDPATLSYGAEIRPPVPGTYHLTAFATLAGQKLGEDQQVLTCEAADQEMTDVRARPDIMASMASVSGGKELIPESADAASLAAVFENEPPPLSNYHRTPFWNKAWWLATVLGLLTLEWALRRLKGLA